MIYIFGDSYVDDTHYIYEGDTIPWYNRFGPTKNFAKSGTGQHYAFKKFYENLSSFIEKDIIIFCMSSWDRIDWKDEHDRTNQYRLNYDVENKKIVYYGNKLKNHDNVHFFFENYADELQNLENKNVSYLYTLSKKFNLKAFILFVYPNNNRDDYSYLNDKFFNVFDIPLFKISGHGDDFPDKRLNHFSDKNHDTMEKYFSDFLGQHIKQNYLWEFQKSMKTGFIYD